MPHGEFGTENPIHATESQWIVNHGSESGTRGTLRLRTQERKSQDKKRKQIHGGGAHIQLLKDVLGPTHSTPNFVRTIQNSNIRKSQHHRRELSSDSELIC